MPSEVFAGISAFKTMMDIAKSIKDMDSAASRNAAVIELQEKIFSAQAAQAALMEQVGNLEQQVVQLKDWESEKQRYQLQAIDTGAFAYMLKKGMENGEPPHWLCTNCFNRGQKSFLQFKGQDIKRSGGRAETSTYGCDTCKATVKVWYSRSPSKPWSPDPA